jgi:transcriptional regulator with XRE-family HTH domain
MEEIVKRLEDTVRDSDKRIQDAADYIGVNRRQISRWISPDGMEMGIFKLAAFCRFYGVSADYILGLPKDLNWPR